jgi:hypothetical protein
MHVIRIVKANMLPRRGYAAGPGVPKRFAFSIELGVDPGGLGVRHDLVSAGEGVVLGYAVEIGLTMRKPRRAII